MVPANHCANLSGETDESLRPFVQFHEKLTSVLYRRLDWLGRDERDQKSEREKSEFAAAFEALPSMWQLVREIHLGLIHS